MTEVQKPEVQVDPAIVAYNAKVAKLMETFEDLASTLADDMKKRQLPEGLRGESVYGPNSARRQQFNKLSGLIKTAGKTAGKLKKGESTSQGGKFVGFAAPAYITPEMAKVLRIEEGKSPLWKKGEKPIFSASLITIYFTGRVMKLGLVHEDDLKVFSCDAQMKELFAPYTTHDRDGNPVTDKEGNAIVLDLDNLTYTGIQKITKNFVEKRDTKNGKPGPPMTEELEKTLTIIQKGFKELKKTKEAVRKAILAVKKAETDLVKAKASLDNGTIDQSLYQAYANAYKTRKKEKDDIFNLYVQQATATGI